MSIGIFTDKQHEPSEAEVRSAIGLKLPLWEELIRHIQETYAPSEDFKFLYGKSYGWGRRFRLKGQLLTTLYPADGYFSVQIILTPQAVGLALSMPIGMNSRQAIEQANPYPEGRWLFIPVQSTGDLEDVNRLLALKINTSRKQKK